jgi:hypothetical protein
MAFIPAPAVAQCELRYLMSTQKVENTLYFVGSAGMNSTLMNSLASALETWWKTNLKPWTSNAVTLNEIYVTDLTTETSPTLSRTVTTSNAGAQTGEALPFNNSFCISFRTANRGRSGRGRNYFVGLTIDTVTSNVVNADITAGLLAGYTALIGAGLFVAGAQWCVVSRYSHGEARSSALIQPIISAINVDTIVDSQRRRLPNRGR